MVRVMAFVLMLLALATAAGAAALLNAAARQDQDAAADVAHQDPPGDGVVPVAGEPLLEPMPEECAVPEPAAEGGECEDNSVDNAAVDAPASTGAMCPRRGALLSLLPGRIRKQRREWAAERGYEFVKRDPYLVDEFTRGAAASGHAPRDIVAGQAFGHEMLLMDIGGVGVMAMRTGAASDTVVDFRRAGELEDQLSEDLVEVVEVCGFRVFSTDASVAQRLIDARVRMALESFPEEVSAVWLESEWVLAQTTRCARRAQWDGMQAPLALLADAARVLPPRSRAAQVLRLQEGDPTRAMEQEAATLASGPMLVAPHENLYEHPPVQRPEEPLEMPTRMVGTAKGSVQHRALGADEVEAIADGKERPVIDADAPRVRRSTEGGSSIFGDEQ